jgi:DNA-directed RNA polymerase subunit RPC12/RpoP
MSAEELRERRQTAVDALTEERFTLAIRDSGQTQRIPHPSLLVLLLDGTGKGQSGRSSELKIPIDAAALEIWAQIRDVLREWNVYMRFGFDSDDLAGSLKRWRTAHNNRARDGHLSEETDLDVTRQVEAWVRMIENKFEPDEKREWKAACPNCGARRVTVDDSERFAITVNVTRREAECVSCGKKWEGIDGLKELRYFTNLAGDTPTVDVVNVGGTS